LLFFSRRIAEILQGAEDSGGIGAELATVLPGASGDGDPEVWRHLSQKPEQGVGHYPAVADQ